MSECIANGSLGSRLRVSFPRVQNRISGGYNRARPVLDWGRAFVMRSLLPLLLVVFAGGCPQAHTDAANVGDDGTPPDPNTKAFCIDDEDCELAGRTCCECPTFALSAGDPKLDACSDVMCPPPQSTCSRIHPVCSASNQCVVACEAIEVTKTCASGFATDPAGCLVDACASLPAPTCMLDDDCVETRADCCGCERGGNNTAVPANMRESYDAQLGCTGGEQCPEADTCVVGETPQCAQGSCKLIAGPIPADACGRPDLPACDAGKLCTVNASDPANKHGVGVCR